MPSPLPLVAMRFARLNDGRYFDLATGTRAWLRIDTIDDTQRRGLAEAGAALAELWHPALSTYLDFGPLGEDQWFEASALELDRRTQRRPMDVSGVAALVGGLGPPEVKLVSVAGAGRLVASLLAPEGNVRPSLSGVRPATCDAGMRTPNPVLLARLAERLEEVRHPGPQVWHIEAPPGSGWSTCWRALARQARQGGFVPLTSNVLAMSARVADGSPQPWVAHLAGHPLVVATESRSWSREGATDLAGLLLVLGALDARSVVVVHAIRRGRPPGPTDRLDPVDARALAPTVRDVHDGPHSVAERPSSALDSAAVDRVLRRAEDFTRQGRHESARRWLRRGGTRLFRRGRDSAGLRLWATLAVTCAERGRVVESERAWTEAWKTAERVGDLQAVIAALPGLAAAWIADLALDRAEALLRGAIAAASSEGTSVAPIVRVRLAECLWWRGRWREARDAVENIGASAASTVRALSSLALGDTARAMAEAIAAVSEAERGGSDSDLMMALAARLRVDVVLDDCAGAARLVDRLAGWSTLVGAVADERDLTLAEASVAERRAVHPALRLKLVALAHPGQPRLCRARARIALALDSGPDTREALSAEVQRVALQTGARALVPDGRAFAWPWPSQPPPRRPPMVQDLVAILEACQRDVDPEAAVQRVSAIVSQRSGASGIAVLAVDEAELLPLGRVGRPPAPTLSSRALALGASVGPECGPDGWEAAWPIRHGDALVGVLACRWTARDRPSSDAVSLLQTAAAAMAPIVTLARTTRATPPPAAHDDALLGASASMERVRKAIERAAPSPFPVLIEGESGVGKELVAHAIHARSTRRTGRFAALNCAALTDDLVEAELFGHARGAFTGAVVERAGLFEDANGGTLFLDEVGELSPRAQAKLLRALQEGEIRRLGETRPRRVDARIVAATNRSLADEAAAGRFRTDLRFRLDVIRIEVPPLRGRPEDIPALAKHFWARAADRIGSRAVLGRDALAALARYDWPGNVRELQNVLAAVAVNASRHGALGLTALPTAIGQRASEGLTLDEARRRFEASFVRGALARAGGSRTRAASELGLTRQGLAKLMDRLGIAPSDEGLQVKA